MISHPVEFGVCDPSSLLDCVSPKAVMEFQHLCNLLFGVELQHTTISEVVVQ